MALDCVSAVKLFEFVLLVKKMVLPTNIEPSERLMSFNTPPMVEVLSSTTADAWAVSTPMMFGPVPVADTTTSRIENRLGPLTRMPRVVPVLLELTITVERAIALMGVYVVAEVPDERAPMMVGALALVELTVKITSRTFALMDAPVAYL